MNISLRNSPHRLSYLSQHHLVATKLIAIFLATIALSSCHQSSSQSRRRQAHNRQPAETIAPKNVEAQALSSQDGTATQPDGSSVPTMSMYVFQQGHTNREMRQLDGDQPLTENQYCFHKSGDNSWLSIQLTLGSQQQLLGGSTGTVHHPQKGEMPYRQTFAGKLMGKQAQVEVTTYLEGITRTREESWAISTSHLDMGRVMIESVPCANVLDDF